MAVKHSAKDATNLLRTLLRQGGRWIPTKHCKEDSMPKRDVDNVDIDNLLRHDGRIAEDGKWNAKYENYVYEVVGTDDRGEELTAAIKFDEVNGRIVVITVY